MSDVPHLSAGDVRQFIGRQYAARRSARELFAVYGTGARDIVEDPAWGRFDIVPIKSELHLREEMPALEDGDARVAFLVPWSTEIPLDLAGRFSQNGKVHRIGREARIGELFGVTQWEAGVSKSALVDVLLARGAGGRYRVGDARLSLPAMWAVWLSRDYGVEVTGGLALDTLLGWAATTAVQPWSAGDAVRAELLEHLRESVDPAAPIVWQAWEARRGGEIAELSVLFEALAGVDDPAVRTWTKLMVKGLPAGAELTDEQRLTAAESLGARAGAALRYVSRKTSDGPAHVRALVHAADARVDDAHIRASLAPSQRLPSAWAQRLDDLGGVLAAAAEAPDEAAVAKAGALVRSFEGHDMFREGEQTVVVKRAEMAVRLLAWLADSGDARLQTGATEHSAAENLGRWYVEDGGYVDWARRAARGGGSGALNAGIAAVVAAADDRRLELDRRFARGLLAWYRADRPANQVVPIDRALERIACRFVDGDDDRRLLVILFDGMAWAQAVEILQSLGDPVRALPWGPLAWHASKQGRIGDGRTYPAVFANLPTITEVSRSAFFAGAPMKPGKTHSTSDDPKRLAGHKKVRTYFDGTAVPALFLKNDGHQADGAASMPALTKIADTSQRVVSVVINAIDSSLSGDTQVQNTWRAEDIKSLPAFLDAARDAGRSVLVASDHGHVPADLLESTPGGGGGKRWRPWTAGDGVGDYEIAFPAEACRDMWSPKGSDGVVLLADDRRRYGGSTNAGEHGGATLSEVVAPCVLIGCDDGSAYDDAGRAVSAAYVPAWWYFEVSGTIEREPIAPAPVKPAVTRKKPPKPTNQLPLIEVAPQPEPPPVDEPPAASESAFARNELLAARVSVAKRRNLTVRAVDYLVARNGVAAADAFCTHLGQPLWRAKSLISPLQEALNVDGYQVIRYEEAAKQVRLDVGLLEQLFEVKVRP